MNDDKFQVGLTLVVVQQLLRNESKIATLTGLVVALLTAVLTLNLSLFDLLFTVAVAKAPY